MRNQHTSNGVYLSSAGAVFRFRAPARLAWRVLVPRQTVELLPVVHLLIAPDHTLLPTDLYQPPEADGVGLLASRMEQLRAHPLSASALLASDAVPHLIDRDVANDLAQLCRLIVASNVAAGAADTRHLPGIVGMRQGPGGTARPLFRMLGHAFELRTYSCSVKGLLDF